MSMALRAGFGEGAARYACSGVSGPTPATSRMQAVWFALDVYPAGHCEHDPLPGEGEM
jgi:hypothetical protein